MQRELLCGVSDEETTIQVDMIYKHLHYLSYLLPLLLRGIYSSWIVCTCMKQNDGIFGSCLKKLQNCQLSRSKKKHEHVSSTFKDWIIITTLYQFTPKSWYKKNCVIIGKRVAVNFTAQFRLP